MVDVTSPIPANTVVGVLINGKLYGLNLLSDTAGADAMGLVGTTPGANTMLGRLKDIVSALIAGPKTAATSLSVAPASDGFAVTTDAAPASTAAAVAKSDTTVLAGMRALWVGGAGDVAATIGGADVIFAAVPGGSLLPIKATKVKATGTTATNMVLLG